MSYALSATVDLPYGAAIEQIREALADQGVSILTEIDLQATLKKKLDVDIAPQVILGACNPPLAPQPCKPNPPSACCCCPATSSSVRHPTTARSSRPSTRRPWWP